MKRRFQLAFLLQAGLQPGDALLDLGCGTLRGGIPLIHYLDRGGYYGLDVRPEVVEEARKELAETGLADKAPTLMVSGNLAGLAIARSFDVIWAFSVLIHMRDEILCDALGFVARHLAEGGAFYANVNLGAQDERQWQKFPLVWRSMDFYVEEAALAGLDVRDVGALGELGHVSNVESQDAQRMLRFVRAR